MAFIPLPLTAEVVLRYSWQNQQVANVFHVRSNAGWTAENLVLLGQTFVTWWDDAMRPLVSNTVTLNEVVCTDFSVEDGRGVIVTDGLPLTGALTEESVPNNVSLAVKWTTGFTGRSFRGRSYHVGLTIAQVTANAVDSTPLAAITAAWTLLRTRMIAADYELVVASRQFNNAPRTVGVVTPIIGTSVDSTLDSQRRRLPGRGS